jgi:hypothetical protein
MAKPHAVRRTTFTNSTLSSRKSSSPVHRYFVREPEAQYGANDLAAIIDNLLKQPLWPAFEHGAYLPSQQAKRIYRLAHGIQALTHILNRSAYARALAQDDAAAPTVVSIKSAQSLNEYQESQAWGALIELGAELVKLVEDLHSQL